MGELIGGNLSILASTLGTPYEPSFKAKILFFEEINEAPYRIDRLLTQLLNSGALADVAGIAIGSMNDCEDKTSKKRSIYRQTVEDVLKDRLLPLKIPIVAGLPFGHTKMNATLPVGVRAILDATTCDLKIVEAAVV
jgi:muramoyltetrapeptide carboxypeptidase